MRTSGSESARERGDHRSHYDDDVLPRHIPELHIPRGFVASCIIVTYFGMGDIILDAFDELGCYSGEVELEQA